VNAVARDDLDSERGERAMIAHKTIVYRIIRTTTRAVYALFFPIRVEGRELVPKSGAVMIAANHSSFLDIPLVSAVLSRHVSFVARDTLAESRWLSWVMYQCGAVLVKRGKSDRAALRAIAAHLEVGDAVVMFPEGTRTRDGRLQELRGGALVAARMARAPILPAAIGGTFRAWPRHKKLPRWARTSIRFGEPIDSAAPDALEQLQRALERLANTEHPASARGTTFVDF
jgi:1-acyl-sn-glycerol-3-phosphate acyltransferase